MSATQSPAVTSPAVTSIAAASSAIVLPFARPKRPANRMTPRDRIEALEWASRARGLGYTRIAFDSSAADDEPELGDFLLIYAPGTMWAAWGVGCCDSGFMVWRPADGTTLSWHATILRALASIPPATP